MALLSSLVMEEASPPLVHRGSQGPSAAKRVKVRHGHVEIMLALNLTVSKKSFSPFWAACCEVGTGERQVDTGEVVGNASSEGMGCPSCDLSTDGEWHKTSVSTIYLYRNRFCFNNQ